MAELAALGLAANVAQFACYGLQTANYLYKAYSDSDDFKDDRERIDAVANHLDTSLSQLQSHGSSSTKRKDLDDLVKLSIKIGKKLTAKREKLAAADKTTWLSRAVFSTRALLSKTEIERLLNQLVSLRDQISHHLITESRQSVGLLNRDMGALGLKIQENHEQAKTQLETLHRDLKSWERNMRNQSETEMLQLLQKMAEQSAAAAEQCLLRRKYEDVLKSLSFPEIVQRHSEIPLAHRNTFIWALKDDCTNLSHWLREGEGIYWIHGKAGSGKSTLMKYLEQEAKTRDDLCIWASGRPLVLASHYFWAIGTDIQRSMKGLLQTLLFRVFIQDPEIIPMVCPARMEGSYTHLCTWSLEELQQCYEKLSALDLPSRICFFIDGLDEYQGDREELVKTFKTTVLSRGIKLCVSSRPWQRFEKAFGDNNEWKLAVHTHTRADIYLYAQEKLNSNERFRQLRQRSPEEADALADNVAKASDGVFLWVYLVVRQLLEGLEEYNEDIPKLTNRLGDFPTDLEDYFGRMLMTIDKAYHYESSVIFSMLLSAQDQISTGLTMARREFVHALSYFGEESFDSAFRTGLLPSLRKLWNSNSMYYPGLDYLESPMKTERQSRLDEIAKERRRVSSRCKDLVHVSQGPPELQSITPGYRIGFLHRSVSDFLVLQTTRQTIEDRLESQDIIQTVGLRGLAQAYLFFLGLVDEHYTVDRRHLSKIMFFRVIQVVKELNMVRPSESQLILFLLWSLFLKPHQDQNPMSAPKTGFLDLVRSPTWGTTWRFSRKQRLDESPQPLIRITGEIYSFCGTAFHDRHDYREFDLWTNSHARQIQTMYGSLTCSRCWKDLFEQSPTSGDRTTAKMLIATNLLCFNARGPGANLESNATTGIERLPDNLNYPNLSEKANLDLVHNLIAALEPDGKNFDRRFQNLWAVFLEITCFRRGRSEENPSWTSEFPSNFRTVVEILVRYGAARNLRFSESSDIGRHFRKLMGPDITSAFNKVSSSFFEIDTLELLRSTMNICADEECGTGVSPQQKTFDMNSGRVVPEKGLASLIMYQVPIWVRFRGSIYGVSRDILYRVEEVLDYVG